MAVTEVMRDPEYVPTMEVTEERALTRGMPCLFCGEWIEPGAEDAFRMLVLSTAKEADYASHAACLEKARHPSVPPPS